MTMIITKKDFCLHVEEQFCNNKMSMIDTVLSACIEYNIDPEMIEPLINRSLKEKMEAEFIDLNYLKAESNVIIWK